LLEILASSSFSPSAQIAARRGGFTLSFCKAKRKLCKEKVFCNDKIILKGLTKQTFSSWTLKNQKKQNTAKKQSSLKKNSAYICFLENRNNFTYRNI